MPDLVEAVAGARVWRGREVAEAQGLAREEVAAAARERATALMVGLMAVRACDAAAAAEETAAERRCRVQTAVERRGRVEAAAAARERATTLMAGTP